MKTSFDLSGLSARNLRVFALGVRGGDGDELDVDALIELANDAERIAALTDEDLAKLRDDLKAAILGLLATPTDDALAGAERVKEARAKVVATVTKREADASARVERAAAIAAELEAEETAAEAEGGEGDGEGGGGEGEGDGDGAGDGGEGEGNEGEGGEGEGAPSAGGEGEGADDAEADAEAERIAASQRPPRIGRVNARRPDVHAPQARGGVDERLVLRASANVPGVPAGQLLTTPTGAVDGEKVKRVLEGALRASAGYRGPRIEVPLMSLGVYDAADVYGEERTLRRDARENDRRIAAVCSPEALRASGGICAPPPIDYTQPILGTNARPVVGALARFGADRGGTRLLPPPTLLDVEDSFGIWTQLNDADPGSDGGTHFDGTSDGDGPETKGCLVMTCPEEEEFLVDALTKCIRVGNFRNRFWSEQVEAWVRKAGDNFARKADTRLLQFMGANMTAVTVADNGLGLTRRILNGLDLAGAGLRNRQRTDPDMPLHWIAPAWLLDAMISDLANEKPGAAAERLAMSDTQIQTFLSVKNINVTWTLDGISGQIFGAQVDGALNPFPSTLVSYLFVEGQELYLDAGTLDFGIVRDSVLNSTNDLQMFSEGFEGYAFHGEEHLKLTFEDICPSGLTAPSADPATYDPCALVS